MRPICAQYAFKEIISNNKKIVNTGVWKTLELKKRVYRMVYTIPKKEKTRREEFTAYSTNDAISLAKKKLSERRKALRESGRVCPRYAYQLIAVFVRSSGEVIYLEDNTTK